MALSLVYIRHLDNQCVTKQISILTQIVNDMFNGSNGPFDFEGVKYNLKGQVKILPATDPRFETSTIKPIILSESQKQSMTELLDAFLIIIKGNGIYSLDICLPSDASYSRIKSFCNNNKHTLMSVELDTSSTLQNSQNQNEQMNAKINMNDLPYQLIKYGVPGTGKSYAISQLISKVYPQYGQNNSSSFVFRTTLYPEYSYYDFVGSITPVQNGGNISYDFTPGIFTLALVKALNNPDNIVFLVIEEMSRANVAAVFGELFQLLDRNNQRESEYKVKNVLISKYAKDVGNFTILNDDIYLPKNFFIYGTVNTSDQNVFVMDNAFKRRFEFEYVSTNLDISKTPQNYIFKLDNIDISWSDFYTKLNRYITTSMNLKEDKQIGPFFIKFRSVQSPSDDEYNFQQILNKLLQYLWNDVHQCPMADKQLFKDNILNFEDLYKKLQNKENVFHEDFFKEFLSQNP